ncbi:hypothetical protein [Geothermobacter hydrogeniphilus]|uniref:Outer membrane lipoprotein-sorting protein n=1 Tax=Geothermobacter hydrogeniphilus TaxID=1969733 RepID=A0A1X0Y437_9BACT|nr:hypothetical protein [Geothermobacter hydrogeniphilus]ORJ59868.1 hypothetical protein B5V00_09355 [Geothermobacter hydrogeniphilus]
MKSLLLLPVLLLLALPALADELQSVEMVARAYAKKQPALENYQVTIQTDQIARMIERMTANLPVDAPRPESPVVRKYWQRNTGKSLFRAEGPNVFPYMQEMVQRFSRDFALELYSFLLPAGRSADRAAFAARAEVKVADNDLAGVKLQTTTLKFKTPVDLKGAFFADGLGLPQRQVTRLVIDVNPEQEILTRLELTQVDGQVLTLEVRYREVPAGQLPEEFMLTSLDGRVDTRFATRFELVDDIWLPASQERIVLHDGRKEVVKVDFVDYRVNVDFPRDIRKLLAP